MSGDSKKAFDTTTTSVFVFYPDELCIVGGASHLGPDERGPLDTPAPTSYDALYRPRRLEKDFKPGFVASIDANGVMQAISIVKRDNVPVVEYGQCRTRAARVVNRRRKEACGVGHLSDREADKVCVGAGFALRRIKCDGKKATSDVISLGRMLAENHQRHDDDLETSLELMKRLLDETEGDIELAAREMGVEPQTVRQLLQYEEHATPETRAAVQAGRLSITAAAIVASEKDPEKQNQVLATLMAAPNPTVRRARQIKQQHTGKRSNANPFHGKKDLVKFKEYVKEYAKQEATDDDFTAGVLAMLNLQTTGAANDKRLTEIFKKFGA